MEEPWNSLINKVEMHLLTTPCFLLARWFDWSKWVAISSLPPTCNFSCMGGVEKKLVTNTSRPESLSQTYIPSELIYMIMHSGTPHLLNSFQFFPNVPIVHQ